MIRMALIVWILSGMIALFILGDILAERKGGIRATVIITFCFVVLMTVVAIRAN